MKVSSTALFKMCANHVLDSKSASLPFLDLLLQGNSGTLNSLESPAFMDTMSKSSSDSEVEDDSGSSDDEDVGVPPPNAFSIIAAALGWSSNQLQGDLFAGHNSLAASEPASASVSGRLTPMSAVPPRPHETGRPSLQDPPRPSPTPFPSPTAGRSSQHRPRRSSMLGRPASGRRHSAIPHGPFSRSQRRSSMHTPPLMSSAPGSHLRRHSSLPSTAPPTPSRHTAAAASPGAANDSSSHGASAGGARALKPALSAPVEKSTDIPMQLRTIKDGAHSDAFPSSRSQGGTNSDGAAGHAAGSAAQPNSGRDPNSTGSGFTRTSMLWSRCSSFCTSNATTYRSSTQRTSSNTTHHHLGRQASTSAHSSSDEQRYSHLGMPHPSNHSSRRSSADHGHHMYQHSGDLDHSTFNDASMLPGLPEQDKWPNMSSVPDAGPPSLPLSLANSARPFPYFLGGPSSTGAATTASTNIMQEGPVQEHQGSEQEEGFPSHPFTHRLGSSSRGANHGNTGNRPKDCSGAASYRAFSLYAPAPSAQQHQQPRQLGRGATAPSSPSGGHRNASQQHKTDKHHHMVRAHSKDRPSPTFSSFTSQGATGHTTSAASTEKGHQASSRKKRRSSQLISRPVSMHYSDDPRHKGRMR
ncbi:hypothetical protein DUNSADRAFT_12009 [Dunaliella salina]|uniref:Uncharacterized protein n=1 Tax=Dunaliella salina TaxID=3046 RepID=A0ABQ7GC37_DUNSA|nr:hypothetical protein DUNSADRAFT_12009 [Dunaliella salina]|eukprot:KAF5832170.1 hypothetical protein DUNSADRAFT_12009 [Dunaliella salina]